MGSARAPVEGLVAEATQAVLSALTGAGIPARFGSPPDDPAAGHGATVHVWPVALVPEPTERDALRLRVHFLVAPDGTEDDPALIDRVLRTAIGDPRLGLVPEPISPQTWVALRARPRIAVVVEVAVYVPRPTESIPRVRGPLRVQEAPLRTVRGRVVGPGGLPLPGAAVRAVDIGASAYTGRDGGFVLTGVPGAGRVRLVVSSGGQHLTTEVAADDPEPSVLSLELEEV